jgi:hypothetical protein
MLKITATHNNQSLKLQDCWSLLLTTIAHVKTLHRNLNTKTNSTYPKRKECRNDSGRQLWLLTELQLLVISTKYNMLKKLYWKHVLRVLKCQYINGVALTRSPHNAHRIEWQLHRNLCFKFLSCTICRCANDNYNLGLIHRSLKVCHLLNTVSIKKEYCQCLLICNSSMPEITSHLNNITHFNTTKCHYYNTLSKHFMETTTCQTKMSFKELKMLMSF